MSTDKQFLILSDITRERSRQEQLKRTGKFVYSCADAGISNSERLAVLSEEVGEVAHEINERIGRAMTSDEQIRFTNHLRAELIQVAAVAVAWVEALDSQ